MIRHRFPGSGSSRFAWAKLTLNRCRKSAAHSSLAARLAFHAHEAGKKTTLTRRPRETSMSFVTTHPEALAYAAGKLQTLGSALAAESAAAASITH